MEQPRWPAGTPWRERGPGPGRFRDESPDWATRLASRTLEFGNPTVSMDYGSAEAMGNDWVQQLVGRLEPKRGYQPGQWERVDPGQHMAERYGVLVQAFIGDGMSPSSARQTAQQMFAEAVVPRAVYANGPHELVIESKNPLPVPDQHLTDYLDGLLSQYPPPGGRPARVYITPYKWLGGGGLTVRPEDEVEYSPIVVLDEDVFYPKPLEDPPEGGGPEFSMPVHRVMPHWAYVTAHEWGHVLTNGEGGPFMRANDGLDASYGMSFYGYRSKAEAAAEAFAEWYGSRGLTTNPAARAYAEHYGWEVPRG